MSDLTGKIAVVTGGTSGIGAACAMKFAQLGAEVLVAGRNAERGEQVVKAIAATGGMGAFHALDTAEDQSIEKLADFIKEKYGEIDILFNNAGIYPMFSPLDHLERKDWDAVFDVNASGMAMTVRYLLPLLIAGNGTILNNASVAGIQSFASGQGYAYAASKSAVIQFTKMTAKIYGDRVRINCICPGIIETPLYQNFDRAKFESRIPMHRVGTPEDVAKVAAFLVSDEAGYINGAAIPIDGGLSL